MPLGLLLLHIDHTDISHSPRVRVCKNEHRHQAAHSKTRPKNPTTDAITH